MAEQYLGEIRTFAFNFAPSGWAQCNGQTLAIQSNTALFSLLGTTYGGNGTTNFQLPNLQSRIGIHQGQGAGLSPYQIGETGGLENVTLLTTNLPAHNHSINISSTGANVTDPSGALLAETNNGNPRSSYPTYTSGSATGTMASGAVATVGGSQPHNNLQPFLCLNFCIALQGIFPSRN
jgi:microcystin-dependent protein